MFAVYRANFNTVDRMNKMALGRASVVSAVGTRTWWKRVLMALLSMSAANAYQGFVRPWEAGQKMTRQEFMDALAAELIKNPAIVYESLPSPAAGPSTPGPSALADKPCLY
jgi:hypothetical protein